jgi:hypothetical protein
MRRPDPKKGHPVSPETELPKWAIKKPAKGGLNRQVSTN